MKNRLFHIYQLSKDYLSRIIYIQLSQSCGSFCRRFRMELAVRAEV